MPIDDSISGFTSTGAVVYAAVTVPSIPALVTGARIAWFMGPRFMWRYAWIYRIGYLMCPASVACAKKQIPFKWFTRVTANRRPVYGVAYEIKRQRNTLLDNHIADTIRVKECGNN